MPGGGRPSTLFLRPRPPPSRPRRNGPGCPALGLRPGARGGGATRRAARPGNGGSRPGAPGRRRAASYTRAATPRATARARVARHSTLSCSLKTTWREETAVGKPRILIADDQPDVLEALRLLLKAEGFEIELAQSPAGVLAALEARDFDVVLLDLNYTRDTTSGKEGLDLLSQIQALDATLPTIVMTAWGSIEGAVEAMRRGCPCAGRRGRSAPRRR